MPCPKCNGRLDWKDRSWTSVGEDPGHWRCVSCGKVIYQDAGRPNPEENIPKNIPSPDCGEKEEGPVEEKKKCLQCNTDFIPKRADSKFCSKVCTDKWRRAHQGVSSKNLGNGGNPRPPIKKISPPAPIQNLDAQLAIDLKAMKKRIAQEVLQICERAIEEAFA